MSDEATTNTGPKVGDYDWPWHVRNYDASGLTKSSYCKQNNLSYHRFLYWHTKLSNSSSQRFAEVKVAQPVLSSEVYCTLELITGNRLLIQSESALQVILKTLV